ncbi:hypothetical protein FNV43_RR07230 [Rhamnella rubrinervis]|uniref:Uncharacterized protein n=1 Tax=Rhamnella rubrinervis TaxID=2594499 RepID=A0A8K0HG43_9ROSA|nr:hypothetical protein FNV43_RR07230 [Rhamnella rubrinervis]
MFSRLSYAVRGQRDMLVVELVARRGVTLRGESSSSSYTGRMFHKVAAPSASGGSYREVGLVTGRLELEGRRQEVVMFIRKEAVMIPLDQFDEDPTEQEAMRAYMQARGYGGPPMVVAEPVEDDTNEDPEEDSLGTDDYVPHCCTPEPIDHEDFDYWDELASD